MPFVPQPPPQSRVIDWATMVAGFDPQWKDPAIVYLMANGRKFLEFNTGDVNIIAYSSEDGLSLYYQTGTTFTFYVRE